MIATADLRKRLLQDFLQILKEANRPMEEEKNPISLKFIQQQNTIRLLVFLFRFYNDTLFRLMVLGQFDLIRELWGNKLDPDLVRLLLEAEKAMKMWWLRAHPDPYLELLKKQAAERNLSTTEKQAIPWEAIFAALTTIEEAARLYQAMLQEYNTLARQYYQNRADIFNQFQLASQPHVDAILNHAFALPLPPLPAGHEQLSEEEFSALAWKLINSLLEKAKAGIEKEALEIFRDIAYNRLFFEHLLEVSKNSLPNLPLPQIQALDNQITHVYQENKTLVNKLTTLPNLPETVKQAVDSHVLVVQQADEALQRNDDILLKQLENLAQGLAELGKDLVAKHEEYINNLLSFIEKIKIDELPEEERTVVRACRHEIQSSYDKCKESNAPNRLSKTFQEYTESIDNLLKNMNANVLQQPSPLYRQKLIEFLSIESERLLEQAKVIPNQEVIVLPQRVLLKMPEEPLPPVVPDVQEAVVPVSHEPVPSISSVNFFSHNVAIDSPPAVALSKSEGSKPMVDNQAVEPLAQAAGMNEESMEKREKEAQQIGNGHLNNAQKHLKEELDVIKGRPLPEEYHKQWVQLKNKFKRNAILIKKAHNLPENSDASNAIDEALNIVLIDPERVTINQVAKFYSSVTELNMKYSQFKEIEKEVRILQANFKDQPDNNHIPSP